MDSPQQREPGTPVSSLPGEPAGVLCATTPIPRDRGSFASPLELLKVKCAVPSCKLTFIRQGRAKFGTQLTAEN